MQCSLSFLVFIFLATLLFIIAGNNLSTPHSVAFSTNHSILPNLSGENISHGPFSFIPFLISFSQIILEDPKWPEAWNKRATVLYMMGKFEESQNDIKKVLKLEKRHFGALSGQGLVQTKLKNYKKAIESYEEVQKIHPSMQAPKIMIPRLKKLIREQSI